MSVTLDGGGFLRGAQLRGEGGFDCGALLATKPNGSGSW
jgi:hypothetical protein